MGWHCLIYILYLYPSYTQYTVSKRISAFSEEKWQKRYVKRSQCQINLLESGVLVMWKSPIIITSKTSLRYHMMILHKSCNCEEFLGNSSVSSALVISTTAPHRSSPLKAFIGELCQGPPSTPTILTTINMSSAFRRE